MIRKSPAMLLFRLVRVTVLLSIVYAIFIYGTDFDEYVNQAVQFFQAVEIGLIAFIIITLSEVAYAVSLLLCWTHEFYDVRHDEIIHQFGLYSVRQRRYALKNMEHIFFTQTVLGRLLNFGTITFQGRFLKEPVVLKNIPDPAHYVQLIKDTTILSDVTH